MRYRTRTGKPLSDQSVLIDLSKGAKNVLSGNSSTYSNFLFGLFNYIVGVSAFISRCFLRIRLGERSFGLITVVSIFFVAWLIFNIPEILVAAKNQFGFTNNSNSVISYIIALFMTPVFLISKAMKSEEEFYGLFVELSSDVQIFIGVITFIAFAHLIEVYSRKNKKELVNSFYRGDSIYFYRLNGKSILGFKVTMTQIWMIFEPILVLIIAYAWAISKKEGIALILLISGICLFLEEFRVYQANRRLELDMIDGWLDAQHMNSLQKQFKNVLELENEKSSEEYRASLDSRKKEQQNYKGSDSPYRAKLY